MNGNDPSPAPVPVQRTKETSLWILYGLILAGVAALRLAQIGKLELWLDEAHSVITATSRAGVLRELAQDTNPPLYFWLLKGWTALFGIGEAGVRSLSALLGVAQLAVLGLWLRSLRLPSRAVLWALLLGALAPLHVYYSQEARGYTLTWLLLTLTLWSFTTAAMREGWRRWWLHGLCLLASLYAHNAVLFFVPAFWIVALLARLDRRRWMRLLAVQACVGLLYLPWFLMTLRVIDRLGRSWIEAAWQPGALPLYIPRSLEVLGLGGHLPEFIRLVSPDPWVRFVGLVWLILLGAALLWVCRAPVAQASSGTAAPGCVSPIPPAKTIAQLAVFTLAPLLFMLAYSVLRRPIYIVGRYDTLVYPAFLGLAGLGAHALQLILARRVGRYIGQYGTVALPMLLVAWLAWASLAPKFGPLPDNLKLRHHPQQMRGEALAEAAAPDDLVVCMGLEGLKVRYQMLRQGVRSEVLTFPLSTSSHPGWLDHQAVANNPELLLRDAETILRNFDPPQPKYHRLWVMMDPYSFRNRPPGTMEHDYSRISSVFLNALAARGLKPMSNPALERRIEGLGILIYTKN